MEDDNEAEMEVARDDVFGAELDPREAKRARQEEITYVRKMKLYDKVPIDECYRVTGEAPITVRWIDINKGDREQSNYRSRLVARYINTHTNVEIYLQPRHHSKH